VSSSSRPISLLTVEHRPLDPGRLSSSSASASSSSRSSEAGLDTGHRTPLLPQHHSNSHHLSTQYRRRSPNRGDSALDYQSALYARPLRHLTWKQIGYLLLVNAAMFWPDYLYPARKRKNVSPERRKRLLMSYAPGQCLSIVLLHAWLCPIITI
jgi:hypothetical protein